MQSNRRFDQGHAFRDSTGSKGARKTSPSKYIATVQPDHAFESGDEYNNDTFGTFGDEKSGPDYDFLSATQKFENTMHKPLHPTPTATVATIEKRVALTVSELEQKMTAIGMTSPSQANSNLPPGIVKRQILSVADIESSLQQTNSSENVDLHFFPPGLDLPPSRIKEKEVTMTFPRPRDEFNPDEFAGLMTTGDQEHIARIHTSQLTSEKPELEDFYYQVYSKRSIKRRSQATTPLYFPLPKPTASTTASSIGGFGKKKGAATRVPFNLEGALGKISSSSSKKPRQQLQVDIPVTDTKELNVEGLTNDQLYFSVLNSIETIFEAIMDAEEAMTIENETDYDKIIADQVKAKSLKSIQKALFLSEFGAEEDKKRKQHIAYCLVRFLSIPKGMKAFGRCFGFLDESSKERLLARLIDYLEYLDVFNGNHHKKMASAHKDDQKDADQKKASRQAEDDYNFVNLFVHNVLSSMVPFISTASWSTVSLAVQRLLAKPSSLSARSITWIVQNRAGVIFLCILLSRIEILKSNMNPEQDSLVLATWNRMIEEYMYEPLVDKLDDIFKVQLSSSPNLGNQPLNMQESQNDSFYIWQFLALLSMSVDSDRKRAMVVELRERIMSIVHEGSEREKNNLNTFLNALGLDISQLSATTQ